jgi:branched-chain amino acid transport system ATP-binding protein
VNVWYGNIHVLNDLSLKVLKGQIAVVIGSNGSGKSTLLKAICGLVHPTSGDILFGEQSIGTLLPHQIVKSGIVYVPEGGGIFRELNVRDNLKLGAYTRRARRAIRSSMQMIRSLFPILEEKQACLAANLSGGEQRMLAIGRGLMGMPELLLVDEPSLGLAPIVVRNVIQAMERIRDGGVTILMAEQNARSALRIADNAYVLDNGSIVLQGNGKQLLEDEKVIRTYLGK